MARLGFGYEALAALNPRLIYCSISGYGQDGPRAQEAGHDINYQALGGLLGQSLRRGQEPPLPPPLVADIGGGPTMPCSTSSSPCGSATAPAKAAISTSPWPTRCGLRLVRAGAGARDRRLPARRRGAPDRRQPPLRPLCDRRWLVPRGGGWSRSSGSCSAGRSAWPSLCGTTRAIRRRRAQPWPESSPAGTPALAQPSRTARCCCTVVRTLEEARADKHFSERGLFSVAVREPGGRSIPSTPLPLGASLSPAK